MGTKRVQRLSDERIIELYLAGESRVALGMKSGLWYSEVTAILERHDVPLRTKAECRALAGRRIKERTAKRHARQDAERKRGGPFS
jgi:hypothetical protein